MIKEKHELISLLYAVFIPLMLCLIFMRVRDERLTLSDEIKALQNEVAALRKELKQNQPTQNQ